MPGVTILELPGGNHNDFLFSHRAHVVGAMKSILGKPV